MDGTAGDLHISRSPACPGSPESLVWLEKNERSRFGHGHKYCFLIDANEFFLFSGIMVIRQDREANP
jgi:hypothetical protein